MPRVLSAVLLFPVALSAFAQASKQIPKPDAPVEQASMGAILLFLALFVGMCAAYGWYMWHTNRKEKQEAQLEKDRAS